MRRAVSLTIIFFCYVAVVLLLPQNRTNLTKKNNFQLVTEFKTYLFRISYASPVPPQTVSVYRTDLMALDLLPDFFADRLCSSLNFFLIAADYKLAALCSTFQRTIILGGPQNKPLSQITIESY